MSSLKNHIGIQLVTSLYYLFRIFPINKKKIFVKNFGGRGFGDSPKYIISYILNHYSNFDVVWSVKGAFDFPKQIRVIDETGIIGLVRSIFEQVTAKVWIDNSRKLWFERKRKNQYYIQTWHGDIGIKKAAGDVVENMQLKEILSAKQDSKMADLFVCGNEWMCKRYREAYWYDGEIAKCGLPRRDIFYSITDEAINNIKHHLNIPKEAKLLLYVPTFRNEDIFSNKLGAYAFSFDWNSVLDSLKVRFGGEWCGLMRLHPNAVQYCKDLILPSRVKNVTQYPDVNELYCISDCCISDYSSSLFEFGVTKKPGFIYAPDKKEYAVERGYYFKEDQIPFPIAKDIKELVDNILSYDEDNYRRKHSGFYVNTIRMYSEGHASKYLAERIVEVCKYDE